MTKASMNLQFTLTEQTTDNPDFRSDNSQK